jgi:hypothetical protein
MSNDERILEQETVKRTKRPEDTANDLSITYLKLVPSGRWRRNTPFQPARV